MSKTNLYKALANFQQEVPVIHKDTKGYGYTYADLPKVFEVINPLLKKHGLGFSQLIQGQSIQTIVFHIESGETLESMTDIPQNVSLKGLNEYQVLGSAITYLRRYSISSILGIVTDKDTNASGEQSKKENEESKRSVLTEQNYNKALSSDQKGIQATLTAINNKTLLATTEQILGLQNKLIELKKAS